MPAPERAAAPVSATLSLSTNIILRRAGRIFENTNATNAKATVA